jgi:hypothetical protein
LFSDFGQIRRFRGFFINWANSKWALRYVAEGKFSLVSLPGKSLSPFLPVARSLKIDQLANTTRKCQPFGRNPAVSSSHLGIHACHAQPPLAQGIADAAAICNFRCGMANRN